MVRDDGYPLQVEAQLSSDGNSEDMAAVQALIKKHQLVEADIAAHEVSGCHSNP